MARERPGHTLEPTALVHEAFMMLREASGIRWQDRHHFFGFVARLMRRALVHHARRRDAEKRGGRAERVTLVSKLPADRGQTVDVLDLDRALSRLERLDPRQGRVVELRFFTGLDIEETAATLGLSSATVKREWATARAWLARELDPSSQHRSTR